MGKGGRRRDEVGGWISAASSRACARPIRIAVFKLIEHVLINKKSSGSVVPMVLVINKVDCAPFVSGEQFGRFSGLFRKHVQTCAVTGKGISELEKAVIEVRGLEPVPSGGRWTVNQVTFFMLRNPMCFC